MFVAHNRTREYNPPLFSSSRHVARDLHTQRRREGIIHQAVSGILYPHHRSCKSNSKFATKLAINIVNLEIIIKERFILYNIIISLYRINK